MTERLHFHFSLSCIGEGNGNPLQCSCLENPRDGGAWWAAVHGVAQSWTRLKRLSSSSSSKEPIYIHDVLSLVTQLCLTLWDPMDGSLPGSSVHGDSPGHNTAVGCHALLQGIVPTQGSNPALLHYREILYHLSQQRSPRIQQWVANPFSRETSLSRNWTRVSCIAGRYVSISLAISLPIQINQVSQPLGGFPSLCPWRSILNDYNVTTVHFLLLPKYWFNPRMNQTWEMSSSTTGSSGSCRDTTRINWRRDSMPPRWHTLEICLGLILMSNFSSCSGLW